MKIFTLESGRAMSGVKVEKLLLAGAQINILAVIVGEEGRGSKRGLMVVDPVIVPQVPCPHRPSVLTAGVGKECRGWLADAAYHEARRPNPCDRCGAAYGPWIRNAEDTTSSCYHPDSGMVPGILMAADVGTTRSGQPKLIREQRADDEYCLVVFRTGIGFRGGNSHTGDRNGKYRIDVYGDGRIEGVTMEEAQAHAVLHGVHLDNVKPDGFLPFPGKTLLSGIISQGEAGRTGSGEQLVAVMPRGVVFRTSLSGRLYGNPGSHYYRFDGDSIQAVTWDERVAADLWF
jgi:hypothetical protein